MGEAKRRRIAGVSAKTKGQRLPIPQGGGLGGPAQDFGIAMWNAGYTDRPIITHMRLDVVVDYGDFREVTGFIYLEEGRFCVTVQTKQTKQEIFAQIDDDNRVVWVHGRLDTEVVTGEGGERYRM